MSNLQLFNRRRYHGTSTEIPNSQSAACKLNLLSNMPTDSQRLKTPRLYKIAAKIIKETNEKGSSLKTLIFTAKHPNRSALYALVHQSLKYRHVIDRVIETVKLFEHEPKLDRTIAQLLVYELLYSKKQSLQGESRAVVAVKNHEKTLREAFKHLDDVGDSCDVGPVLPRYVRVNTLKTSVKEFIGWLQDESFHLVEHSDVSNDEYVNLLRSLEPGHFLVDIHVPDLLVFHPKQHFYDHWSYLEGYILLQDKASCLPAHILAPPADSHVFDACAAPGMKTTQMAAIMGDSGKIYATDLNITRMKTLENMLQLAGVSCCEFFCKDFSSVDPTLYDDVEYILVDPSCSGSGIVTRVDNKVGHTDDDGRLRKLSNFQVTLLKRALSFPRVKKVVYSTCSVNVEENEKVIAEVLSDRGDEFKLVNILTNWTTRGSSDYRFGCKCVRSSFETNLTNGFFVAMFKRKKHKFKSDEEVNQEPSSKKKRKKNTNKEFAGRKQ